MWVYQYPPNRLILKFFYNDPYLVPRYFTPFVANEPPPTKRSPVPLEESAYSHLSLENALGDIAEQLCLHPATVLTNVREPSAKEARYMTRFLFVQEPKGGRNFMEVATETFWTFADPFKWEARIRWYPNLIRVSCKHPNTHARSTERTAGRLVGQRKAA